MVIVHRHPWQGTMAPNEGCSLVGAVRTAKVTLAEALGDRVVLEAQQGLPISVTAP